MATIPATRPNEHAKSVETRRPIAGDRVVVTSHQVAASAFGIREGEPQTASTEIVSVLGEHDTAAKARDRAVTHSRDNADERVYIMRTGDTYSAVTLADPVDVPEVRTSGTISVGMSVDARIDGGSELVGSVRNRRIEILGVHTHDVTEASHGVRQAITGERLSNTPLVRALGFSAGAGASLVRGTAERP